MLLTILTFCMGMLTRGFGLRNIMLQHCKKEKVFIKIILTQTFFCVLLVLNVHIIMAYQVWLKIHN